MTKSAKKAPRNKKRLRSPERCPSAECAACGEGGNLVLCSVCGLTWHIGCAKPPINAMPKERWYCKACQDTRAVRLRQELPGSGGFAGVVELVRRSRSIVVVAGAGISVSCGIPDFRSENGVYSLISELGLELDQPECLFDLETFVDNPAPFYRFAHRLFPGRHAPSATHHFIRLLEQKRKLRRLYTQNIDALELSAGIKRVVHCHGSLAKAVCLRCRKRYPAADIAAAVAAQRVPLCPKGGCGGVLKPTVTFFGERLGNRVGKALESDFASADLLLVVGTSLKVAPVSGIVGYLKHVPQLLVNLESVRLKPSVSVGFDAELLGPSDVVCTEICRQLGWDKLLSEKIGANPDAPGEEPIFVDDQSNAHVPNRFVFSVGSETPGASTSH